AAFFTALDKNNERWHELNEHPNWLFFGDKIPKREELLKQFIHVVEQHPKTTIIGAHFGNNVEDLATVGKWLDEHPNLNVDLDARISELGRQPYTARKFFLKYQDRIMFGTDTTPRRKAWCRIGAEHDPVLVFQKELAGRVRLPAQLGNPRIQIDVQIRMLIEPLAHRRQ